MKKTENLSGESGSIILGRNGETEQQLPSPSPTSKEIDSSCQWGVY